MNIESTTVKDIVDLFIRRNSITNEYSLVTIDHMGDEVILEIGQKEKVAELANSILFYFAENEQ